MTEPEFAPQPKLETVPPIPERPPSAGAGVVLSVVAAVLLLLVALLQTSQVTTGPVLVGAALLFAVFARISQASAHHREQWQWRGRGRR